MELTKLREEKHSGGMRDEYWMVPPLPLPLLVPRLLASKVNIRQQQQL